MIKRSCVLFLSLVSLTSCLTTAKGEMHEFSAMKEEEALAIEAAVEIPEVELFISAPFSKVSAPELIDADDIYIPAEDIPEIIIAVAMKPEPSQEIETPVGVIEIPVGITIDDAVEEILEKDISLTVPMIEDSASGVTDSPAEGISPVEEIPLAPPLSEVIVSRGKRSTAGSEFIIELEKEGWIYSSSDSQSVEMKNREFTGDTTRFLFAINDAGSFLLSFYLQDPSSGISEEAEYSISVENPNETDHRAIVIEPELENEAGISDSEFHEDILIAVEEENIPELVASFELLVSRDDPVESTVLSKAFNLLERQGGYDHFLVDLAENAYQLYPYDNQSAELLYKAALAIEKPGPGQNIAKAMSLFKLVREHFPISIYCDKSEERIRYLERHFMKIY